MLFNTAERPYVPPTHVCHSAEVFNKLHFTPTAPRQRLKAAADDTGNN